MESICFTICLVTAVSQHLVDVEGTMGGESWQQLTTERKMGDCGNQGDLSESPQKRTGAFSLGHYFAGRTLPWAGHVARMSKNRLPKRLMLPWIREPRVAGGQEMTYGRSLQRHLNT